MQEKRGEGDGSISASQAYFFMETGTFFPCMLRKVLFLRAQSTWVVLALVPQRLDALAENMGSVVRSRG